VAARFYVTGSYDPATNLTYWGAGNPVPGYDSSYRPGDNLFTNSAIAFDAKDGKIKWHFQYTPNDNRDYDEVSSHILIDTKVNGEDRKIVSHAGRNGFQYVIDRLNGQFLKGTQNVKEVTWTKGLDPKTGRPVDYDPARDVADLQRGRQRQRQRRHPAASVPTRPADTNFWPPSYSRKTGMIYIPANEGCSKITPDTSAHVKGKFSGGTFNEDGRITSAISAFDPNTGEIKGRAELPYPNASGVLSTAGGIVVTAMLDGTIVAFDDQTMQELWKVNVGTGINAPPITYSVSGKQYIAIATGLWRNSRNKTAKIPELRAMSNSTMLFVFGL